MKRLSLFTASLILILLLSSCGGNPLAGTDSSGDADNLLGLQNESTSADSSDPATTVVSEAATADTTIQTTTVTTGEETTAVTEATVSEPAAPSTVKIADIVAQGEDRTLFLADNGDVYLAGTDIFDVWTKYKSPVLIFSGAKSIIAGNDSNVISIVGTDNNYYVQGTAPNGTIYTAFTPCMSDVLKAGNELVLKLDGSLYFWTAWGDAEPQLLLNGVKDY